MLVGAAGHATPAVNWPKLLHNATRVRQKGGTTDKARLKHLREVLSHVPEHLHGPDALWMELGVREGVSINFMSNITGSSQRWHGFDSFSGMPDSSRDTTSTWRAGKLTLRTPKSRLTSDGLPRVRENVELHKGWFNETVAPMLDRALTRSSQAWVAFMHLDADIYESTYLALTSACTRGLLRVGSVLAFDELFSTSSLQQTLGHEWRALNDAAALCGFAFEFITWMKHFASPYVRVAVRVASTQGPGRGGARSGRHLKEDHGRRLASCGTPRNIYIDGGVNWCNTLTLHRALPRGWLRKAAPGGPWHVFGFEASPLLHPYIEQCTKWLSAGKELLPPPPVPPAGSTSELIKFAKHYNLGHCTNVQRLQLNRSVYAKQYQWRRAFKRASLDCLNTALKPKLDELQAVPSLSENPQLLRQRLASAASCESPERDAYTMVPAGLSHMDGTINIVGNVSRNPLQLVSGGLRSMGQTTMSNQVAVKVVDLVSWLQASVSVEDFVVVKLDIEGAEHHIVKKLLELNATKLIDIWLWECHPAARNPSCPKHEESLRVGGIKHIKREPYVNFNLTRLARYSLE